MAGVMGTEEFGLEHEIVACVTGIGGQEEGEDGSLTFVKGDECLACIHDLQRMLRRDDPEERPVLRKLLSLGVVETFLLPLVVSCQSEYGILFTATKLIVMVTLPLPTGVTHVPLEIQSLQSAKEAFLKGHVLGVFMQMLADPLSQKDERSDDDNKLTELILSLFRNILRIPDPAPSIGNVVGHRAHLHDNLIIALDKELVLETLVVLTQTIDEDTDQNTQNWTFLLGEIIFLLLQGQTAPDLVRTADERHCRSAEEEEAVVHERESNATEFEELRRVEALERREVESNRLPRRHPRFGTLFVVNTDGGGRVITSQPFGRTAPVPRKKRHVPFRPNKAVPSNVLRQSSFKTRSILYDFCVQFLASNCFNALMNAIHYHFDRAVHLETNDIISTHWVAGFFCSFGRSQLGRKNADDVLAIDMSAVGTMMTMEYLHSVFSKIEDHCLNKEWVGVSVAFRALKEVLLSIVKMNGSNRPEEEQRVANALKNNLFYEGQTCDVIVGLLRRYKPHLQERQHLLDLVEAVHVVTRMLDEHGKEQSTPIVVLKKKKKRRKAENPAAEDGEEGDDVMQGSENAEEPEEEYGFVERNYDLQGFVEDLAHPDVLDHYGLILADFQRNPPDMNHAVAKFFHRVAIHSHYLPMFFRLPLFNVFERLLNLRSVDFKIMGASHSSAVQQLVVFARYVVHRFFDWCQQKPVVFVEPFFRHNRADARSFLESVGEDVIDLFGGGRAPVAAWTEEEDQKLRDLFAEYGELPSARDIIPELMDRSLGQISRRLGVLLLPALPLRPGGTAGSSRQRPVRGVDETECFVSSSEDEGPDDYIVPEADEELREILVEHVTAIVRQRQPQAVEWLVGVLQQALDFRPPAGEKKAELVAGQEEGQEESAQLDSVLNLGDAVESEDRTTGEANGGEADDLDAVVAVALDGGGAGEAAEKVPLATAKSMLVVPTSQKETRYLRMNRVRDLLNALALRPPTQSRGYWRLSSQIPTEFIRQCASWLEEAVVRAEESLPPRRRARRDDGSRAAKGRSKARRARPAGSDEGGEEEEGAPSQRRRRRRRQVAETEESQAPVENFTSGWRQKAVSQMTLAEIDLLVQEETQAQAMSQEATQTATIDVQPSSVDEHKASSVSSMSSPSSSEDSVSADDDESSSSDAAPPRQKKRPRRMDGEEERADSSGNPDAEDHHSEEGSAVVEAETSGQEGENDGAEEHNDDDNDGVGEERDGVGEERDGAGEDSDGAGEDRDPEEIHTSPLAAAEQGVTGQDVNSNDNEKSTHSSAAAPHNKRLRRLGRDPMADEDDSDNAAPAPRRQRARRIESESDSD